jgi:hypothetical protein
MPSLRLQEKSTRVREISCPACLNLGLSKLKPAQGSGLLQTPVPSAVRHCRPLLRRESTLRALRRKGVSSLPIFTHPSRDFEAQRFRVPRILFLLSRQPGSGTFCHCMSGR